MLTIVEGMEYTGTKMFASKLADKSRWPVYDYPYRVLDSERYGIEREEFDKRMRIVDFISDVGMLDVIIPNFYFDMSVRGIVDAGWYAMSTIRRAEKLSERLSDMGATLILCDNNNSLRTDEKRSEEDEAKHRVRLSLFDYLYSGWTGKKKSATVYEYDHVIHNLLGVR